MKIKKNVVPNISTALGQAVQIWGLFSFSIWELSTNAGAFTYVLLISNHTVPYYVCVDILKILMKKHSV